MSELTAEQKLFADQLWKLGKTFFCEEQCFLKLFYSFVMFIPGPTLFLQDYKKVYSINFPETVDHCKIVNSVHILYISFRSFQTRSSFESPEFLSQVKPTLKFYMQSRLTILAYF